MLSTCVCVQMEINKAILEENEASEEAEGGGGGYVVDGEEVVQPEVEKEQVLVAATATRTRNRPKRDLQYGYYGFCEICSEGYHAVCHEYVIYMMNK